MTKLLKNFRDSESGAAMVEYAIALLVAAGIGVATFTTMGTQAGANAELACDALTGGANAGCDQTP
jgi:Flp pilus assembly pilin Flp